MQFSPKTEEELQQENLLPEGTYPFSVALASNETSEKGNPMLKLTLHIWDSDGKIRLVDDYLLEAMGYKLRHFCEAANILNIYETGDLNPKDCINKKGDVKIIIQEGKLKADGTRYRSRNSVKDYVVPSASSENNLLNDLVDDIAF